MFANQLCTRVSNSFLFSEIYFKCNRSIVTADVIATDTIAFIRVDSAVQEQLAGSQVIPVIVTQLQFWLPICLFQSSLTSLSSLASSFY